MRQILPVLDTLYFKIHTEFENREIKVLMLDEENVNITLHLPEINFPLYN